MKSTSYLLQFSILLITLLSCKYAFAKLEDDADDMVPINILYDNGLKNIANEEYVEASKKFEKIFFQDPGHEITPHAELMHAYSLYLSGQYSEAVDVLKLFIKLHRRHKYIAYAYYLKAQSVYVQISDLELDQSVTSYAVENFEEVIRYFPDTKFAKDAVFKIALANDYLSAKEINIGCFYLKKQNPAAAINRFQTVIRSYKNTRHAPEAFYRLVEANIILGLLSEAKKYNSALKDYYPESEWAKHSNDLLKSFI